MSRPGSWAALVAVLLASSLSFAGVACGAFSHSGVLATANIDRNTIQLQLLPSGGTGSTYSIHATPAKFCKISFSDDDQLVAVSILKPRFVTNGVAIAILDTHTDKWTVDKIIEPPYSQFLGGFLGASHDMATAFVSGEWERGSALRFQIFSVNGDTGQKGQELLRPLEAPATSLFPNAFDPTHNRLWHRIPQSPCALRSVAILGERQVLQVPPDLVAGCRNADAIEIPDSNLAVIASQTLDSVKLWRIQLREQHSDQLEISADANHAFQLLDMSSHSSDGKILAFAVKSLRKDKFGGLHEGELAVALVDAVNWKVLQITPLKIRSLTDLAIDHRDGKIDIAAYDGSHWSRTSVTP